MAVMTKTDLEDFVEHALKVNLNEISTDGLKLLMTATQYLTDLCLNEIEERGDLEIVDGYPVVPYLSDHFVDTILTRQDQALN